MNLRKRIALLLLLVMILTLVPGASFAEPPVGPCDGRDSIRNGGNHFWTITNQQDPDCYNGGYITYRCVYCNRTYTDTVPALGHDWMGPQTIQAPTCTEDGVERYVCRRNSDHTFTKAVPALGHDWTDWYVLKAPTLTEEGILERKCERCGLTEQMPIPLLGQKDDYDLTLIMIQLSPKTEAYDYEDLMNDETGGILLIYDVTLINTGTEPLNVLDYTGGTGQSSQLPTTVTLYPGEYANVSLPWSMGPMDIIPGTASENLFGATEFDFYFFGDSLDGEAHVCTSNTESFDYQVKDPEGYTGWPIPSESAVIVEKVLLNDAPADPSGYQLGETLYYNLYVQNVGDVAIQGLTLLDSMYGYPEEVMFSTDLEPGEGKAAACSHTVGPDDVNAGFVSNRAVARWADPDSAEAMEQRSTPVIVPVTNKASLVLHKSVVGAPANSLFYVPGETVHYQVSVLNNFGTTQKAIMVVDPLVGESRTCPDLAPGESVTLDFDYVVTEFDALMTYVDNYAYAMEVDDAVSNVVRVDTGFDDPAGYITDLAVTKAESSTPADPKGYQLGETITYVITVTNVGETLLTEGIVCDSLQDGSGEIGAFENLYPGTSRTYSFYHIVNEQDVQNKKVVNQAAVWYDLNGHGAVQTSNLVESPVWCEDPYGYEFDDDGSLLSGDDCCSRTLTGKGSGTDAFTVHFCADHLKVLEELKAAESSEEEYLKAARTAWQKTMDALYEAACEKAGSEAAAAIMNQRLTYLAYLETYEALLNSLYPDEPLTVARELEREMRERCVDLCYDLHTAPQARVDSVLGVHDALDAASAETCVRVEGERDGAELKYTEVLCDDHAAADERIMALVDDAVNKDARTAAFLRAQRMWEAMLNSRTNDRYKAADKEARVLIAQNRLAFDKYVAARKALLTILYADRPDMAAEVVARMVQDKEMDLCRLWK